MENYYCAHQTIMMCIMAASFADRFDKRFFKILKEQSVGFEATFWQKQNISV